MVGLMLTAEAFKEQLRASLSALSQILVPTGMVGAFMRASVPEGWIGLNGQKVYSSVYPRLYEYLYDLSALTKGEDDDGAYAVLPASKGRVIQGTDNVLQVGQLLEASLPNISGKIGASGSAIEVTGVGAFTVISGGTSRPSLASGNGDWQAFFNASDADARYGLNFQYPAVASLFAIRF